MKLGGADSDCLSSSENRLLPVDYNYQQNSSSISSNNIVIRTTTPWECKEQEDKYVIDGLFGNILIVRH